MRWTQPKSRQNPLKRKSMDVSDGATESLTRTVDIKPEPMMKEEPEDRNEVVLVPVPRQCCNNAARVFNINQSIDHLNIEDLNSSSVKSLKATVKAESKIDLEPNEAQRNTFNGNTAMENQSKNGDEATRFTVGTSKKKSNDLKGGSKAVINAADGKHIAAKRAKKQHKCASCDYVAQWPSQLKMHMSKHSGEKPFRCKCCTKRFTQKSSLKTHLKTHTDGMLSCSNCRKRFAQNYDRLVHETTCYGRQFGCHLCKNFFTCEKSQLTAHVRVHNDWRR